MKIWTRTLPTVFLMALTAIFPPSLSAQEVMDDIDFEITEGKIAATEMRTIEELTRDVRDKQAKATGLISLLTDGINSRYGANDEAKKEEIEYAQSGFIARLQGIREDQEALARKEIQPDLATLQEYSRRLDGLIADIKLFLK